MVTASGSADYIGLANAPILWILALAVMGVVVVQSLIYMSAVKKNAESAGMSRQEVRSAFRAGGVAAIGPSLSVVLVAIALLPLFGTPPVIVRVGLIGSAATEVASASLAAGTMGANLGDETFTRGVFIVALMAMSLSGAGWMISTLILTPIFKRSSNRLEKVNPALMSIIPGAALLAAFAALTFRELPKSPTHVVAVVVSAVAMSICLFLARTFKQNWLKEWGWASHCSSASSRPTSPTTPDSASPKPEEATMSSIITSPSHAAFERTTTRWGSITLFIGFLIATSVPFYLLFVADANIDFGQILKGFLAVFAVYGVFYIVEPLTYFPILGPAGMYQAFMIGNVANKLLPSAIVAQDAIGAKPGTRKGEYAATMAICGAAIIHVASMVLFVGLLGTWLVSLIPAPITLVAKLYILPAILGGVTVQLIASLRQVKSTLIALGLAALVILVLIPLVPILAPGDVAIVVFLTILITWFTRNKTVTDKKTDGGTVGIN